MSWQIEMGETLRVMVGDLAGATYTDSTLQRTLVVGARLVYQDGLNFTQNYVMTVDPVSPNIVPDPTDDVNKTRDYNFINLSCLKAASIIYQGSAVIAASQAIFVRDGSSSIDLRGVFGAWAKLLEKGYAAVYQQAKTDFLLGSTKIAGAAVMTPFRLFALGDWGPSFGDRWSRTIVY